MLALIPCGPCDRLADPIARPSSVTSRAQACHWFLWRGDDIPARFFGNVRTSASSGHQGSKQASAYAKQKGPASHRAPSFAHNRRERLTSVVRPACRQASADWFGSAVAG